MSISRVHERKLLPIGRHLLGGTSSLALLTALVATPAPALAQADVQNITGSQVTWIRSASGTPGVNGVWHFLPWVDNEPATAGGVAGDLKFKNLTTISRPSGGGPVVQLVSTGGKGGNGENSVSPQDGGAGGSILFIQQGTVSATSIAGDPMILLRSQGGLGGRSDSINTWADGGAGGAVSFTQNGNPLTFFRGQSESTSLIWLQSIGGDGAKGEDTRSGDSAIIGQRSGGGGSGGPVSASIQTNIQVSGDNLAALRLTSQGGAGGYGGSKATSPRLQSSGGTGGSASVTVDASATISTSGGAAPAVIIEALGGRGGDSLVANGSRGADGGAFNDSESNPSVLLTNRGTIRATGKGSTAIVAQSIGGTGGDGASSAVEYLGLAGGNGGNGGWVVINQLGKVETTGDYAFGIVAQSLGGSGGEGGSQILGGNGGDAGTGGTVKVTNAGTITTNGKGSSAIVAQSIGGGKAIDAFQTGQLATKPVGGGAGGSGGFLFFGSGGDGGKGGIGGAVTVNNSGTISAKGDSAAGILAQSIGGGGGGGGNTVTFGFLPGISFSVALGGNGGVGGAGGAVTVNNLAVAGGPTTGSISTDGRFAPGILAQSVGGGGGVGGRATAVSVGLQLSIARAVGGSGGEGGSGGAVVVKNGLGITTKGSNSSAIDTASIGGGGGNGGDALAASVALGLDKRFPNVTIASTTGGKGGKGNTAGTVTVQNSAALTTDGASSFGISAMSIGGGGGNGGTARSVTLSVPYASSVNISAANATGGSGGTGSWGNTVTVDNSGAITTKGALAMGISAMSIGGGGGQGGNGEILAQDLLAQAKGVSLKFSSSVGGDGGSGNYGGTVKVTNSGDITTQGFSAIGLQAMSVGGGGGNGGDATPLKLGTVGDTVLTVVSTLSNLGGSMKNAAASDNVGGKGASGSYGGDVTVINSGSITTGGAGASGIQAQSIGGGGGIGGASSLGIDTSFTYNSTVGGNGGSGNNGGKVSVTTTSVTKNGVANSITTGGTSAYAIFAQSIGGGGGVGGASSSVSGGGTDAATAPAMQFIANFKDIGFNVLKGVLQNLPDATKAQLVDKLKKTLGSFIGGKAGNWVNKAKPSIPITLSYNASVGGSGGAGGNGGEVSVTNGMALSTTGDASAAIFAQSIGGGGGAAGSSQVGSNKLISLKSTIGGSGAGGGAGDKVEVTNTGAIDTLGHSAFGIAAQSVGGGGGVTAMNMDLQAGTQFPHLQDLLDLPIPAMSVGGSGGVGGAGKSVTVTNTAAITTHGAEAHGVVAQSIGGGGGISILNSYNPEEMLKTLKDARTLDPEVKAALALYGIDVDAEIQKAEAIAAANRNTVNTFKIALGGESKASGNGGAVAIVQGGTISTEGMGAFGLLAQSIGGGGGLISFGNGDASRQNTFTGRLGGDGVTGDGGAITITLAEKSTIKTKGTGAVGIFAQSIGGGGGYIGNVKADPTALNALLANRKNASGSGGNITITSKKVDGTYGTTEILTEGRNAHGIFAQSLGGGGGAMGSSQGVVIASSSGAAPITPGGLTRGGEINIDINGTITAKGEGSVGIFAQSGVQGNGGLVLPNSVSGSINVTFDGTLTGGTGTGAAIQLDGGTNNTIMLRKGATVSAGSNVAILGSFAKDTVKNYGSVTGDVNLVTGGTTEYNEFQNEPGATYQSAGKGSINLGPNGLFTNNGVFSIGGKGTIANAALIGGFTQSANGALQVDVSRTPQGGTSNDFLNVTGAADLKGVVQANVVGGLMPGSFKIATISGPVTGSMAGAVNTYSPITWSVTRTGGTIELTPRADIKAPEGVNMKPTEDSLMAYLQKIWNNGGISQKNAAVFGDIANVTSVDDYITAIDSTSPDESSSAAALQTLNSRTSVNMALSCPVFAGTGAFMEETSCTWARIIGDWTQQTSSNDTSGFNQSAVTYRVGAQRELATDWFFGGTVGFTQSWLDSSDNLSSTEGNAVDVALSLKRQVGPWLFAIAGSAGYGAYDTDRVLDIGPAISLSSGTANVFTAAARFRASYEFVYSNWYIKPYADFDLLYTYLPSYQEQGLGTTLGFNSAQQWNAAFSPNVEFGARVDLDPQIWLRPYATVGMTVLAKDNMKIGVNLNDTASSLGGFVTEVSIPGTLLNLSAGVQLFNTKGYEVRGEYKVDVGDNYLAQQASARFAMPF
ncbi:hypothetical protein V5F77_06465 [Xanthobacter sp. DSM 24535]|uniref:hypothetical protein n=1 Tax=Roseixanthobacter psychrophilus TaxID=3119917 RepID=UPI00372B23AC